MKQKGLAAFNKNKKKLLSGSVIAISLSAIVLSFQNCSKVGMLNTKDLSEKARLAVEEDGSDNAQSVAETNPATEVDDRLFDPVPVVVKDEQKTPEKEDEEKSPKKEDDDKHSPVVVMPPIEKPPEVEKPPVIEKPPVVEPPVVVNPPVEYPPLPVPEVPRVVVDKSEKLILRSSKKADILLVIDHSASMKEDTLKLADKLKGFAEFLDASDIDWQMCLTTTTFSGSKGNKLYSWNQQIQNDLLVLNKEELKKIGAQNLFKNAVSSLFVNVPGEAGNEQGIWVINHLITSNDHKFKSTCLRNDATFNSIIISDEDEKSDGLNLSEKSKPDNLIQAIQGKFNLGKTYVHHSIVILPEDEVCRTAQNEATKLVVKSPKKDTWYNFFGKNYIELTSKTGGVSGSICDNDYTNTLTKIGSSVQKQAMSVQLSCQPLADSLKVSVSTLEGAQADLSLVKAELLDGKLLRIIGAPDKDLAVKVDYQCYK